MAFTTWQVACVQAVDGRVGLQPSLQQHEHRDLVAVQLCRQHRGTPSSRSAHSCQSGSQPPLHPFIPHSPPSSRTPRNGAAVKGLQSPNILSKPYTLQPPKAAPQLAAARTSTKESSPTRAAKLEIMAVPLRVTCAQLHPVCLGGKSPSHPKTLPKTILRKS
jgi:hypothetical protein